MNLFAGNDLRVELRELLDKDGAAVTGATVTAVLFTHDQSQEVGGVTWPVTLSDEGSGNYGGTIESDVNVTAGDDYWLRVMAVKGQMNATWWRKFKATLRPF